VVLAAPIDETCGSASGTAATHAPVESDMSSGGPVAELVGATPQSGDGGGHAVEEPKAPPAVPQEARTDGQSVSNNTWRTWTKEEVEEWNRTRGNSSWRDNDGSWRNS
jgi:hypothetical protein